MVWDVRLRLSAWPYIKRRHSIIGVAQHGSCYVHVNFQKQFVVAQKMTDSLKQASVRLKVATHCWSCMDAQCEVQT